MAAVEVFDRRHPPLLALGRRAETSGVSAGRPAGRLRGLGTNQRLVPPV